jgi:hypothetical protein
LFELLSLIASIIAIVGGVWAFGKFILRPLNNKRREFSRVVKIIDDDFERWKENSYSSLDDYLIMGERFLEVNKFRDKLLKIEKDKLTYLFRCSVQNGKWGEWLLINQDNDKIIPILILILDGGGGWRPIWRSVYILEKVFGKSINQLFNHLPEDKQENENIQFAFEVMKSKGVESYLKDLSKRTEDEWKTKARQVLHEIEHFSTRVNTYVKRRNIQSLEKLGTLRLSEGENAY